MAVGLVRTREDGHPAQDMKSGAESKAIASQTRGAERVRCWEAGSRVGVQREKRVGRGVSGDGAGREGET